MTNQRHIFICLCLLYYLQGIPYGIQIKLLPIYYYDILKYPIDFVTKTSLLMSPWIFLKPLISQFVESKQVMFFFLYVGLNVNAVLNLCLYNAVSHQNNLLLTFFLLFLINCFTVLMDVATDQITISSTSSNDLKVFGISNSIQIVAYKFGGMFSGALILIIGYSNIDKMFILLSIVYFVVFICLLHFLPNNFKTSKSNSSNGYNGWIQKICEIFSERYTILVICYVVIYKLGEMGANTLFPIFMINSGFSGGDASVLSSIISELPSLCGSLLGGFVWSLYKPVSPVLALINTLLVIGLLRVIPLALQICVLIPGFILSNYTFLVAAVSTAMLSFIGGMVSTLTFTLMMVVACRAPENYKATHYAFFSSIEVLGKLVFSSYLGTLSLFLSKAHLYILFCATTVVASILLYFLRKDSCNVKIK